MSRVVVIGLDCATPQLAFERYRQAMPNLARLMQDGCWGPMTSVAPPITVPAWACMTSGRDPGELGLYGFRNRVRGEYALRVSDGDDVPAKRVWDYLGDQGYRVSVLFVPQTFPPRPVHGSLVSGFMCAQDGQTVTFPSELHSHITERFGTYRADVFDFRSRPPSQVFDDIVTMTRQHFAIARDVWGTEEPDFMMMVEIGLDRFHHVFWEHIDPEHPRHDPNNPWKELGEKYYALLDQELGDLLGIVGTETTVLVVSDHGARAMQGGFAINQWLIEEGLLTVQGEINGQTRIVPDRVDWSTTRAWAEGGYYARVFLNMQGREPQGIVPLDNFESLRHDIAARLEALRGPRGKPLGVQVQVPESSYRVTRGLPPDLMVYLGDLDYRAIGTVGHPHLFVDNNDTGADGCNHDWNGIFVMAGPGTVPQGQVQGATLYDVTRTVLDLMDVSPPADLLGRSWCQP